MAENDLFNLNRYAKPEATLDPSKINIDPVVVHAIELRKFCQNQKIRKTPLPLPTEDTSKRSPNPNEIKVSDFPKIDEHQCKDLVKGTIGALAEHVGFDEIEEEAFDNLTNILDDRLQEMMDFYVVCERRRIDKLPCAFKSNIPKQVLVNYGVRNPGVLQDYYNTVFEMSGIVFWKERAS
ncbi:hypothetical protein L596_011214 [Steinernema carpocapsae]|uniref:Uncharacterized protein n=1 Tax=Steinernema carpocapsae TaxID=34508 RepID=A0A4U5NT28_STECR|nr:hypothetical protein L596_011214 [Steinernema carpocapsae]